MGRGESWAFARLAAETRISFGGRLLLWEPLLLDNTDEGEQKGGDTGVRQRMAGCECFCLLVLLGPRVEPAIQAVNRTQGRPTFQQRVATSSRSSSNSTRGDNAQHAATSTEVGQRCITSLCRLWDSDDAPGKDGAPAIGNALALKVAGKTTEDVYAMLASLLAPLEGVVGCRPYGRRG